MTLKTTAEAGITSLLQAGAHMTIVRRIQNKTLARDNDLIAEGRFNWLSAAKTSGGTHQMEERTLVVEGKQAKEMIDEETAYLKNIDAGKELVNGSAARSKAFSKATFWWFLASYGLLSSACLPPCWSELRGVVPWP